MGHRIAVLFRPPLKRMRRRRIAGPTVHHAGFRPPQPVRAVPGIGLGSCGWPRAEVTG
ncbi:hypothetical protein ABZZ79_03645 [Streptomyces sp. NPDC006458]|uniref:hypothetical protein n=1 Tax=Streptomyces sp. NPDC006458 TaxID=3154302 RepID=UPI0033A534DB